MGAAQGLMAVMRHDTHDDGPHTHDQRLADDNHDEGLADDTHDQRLADDTHDERLADDTHDEGLADRFAVGSGARPTRFAR